MRTTNGRSGGRTLALATVLLVLAAARPAPAATITWGLAQSITGDANVSTSGALVGALNLGSTGVANTTVNGVTFNALAFSGNNVSSGNFQFTIPTSFQSGNFLGNPNAPFSTLSAPYQALLESGMGEFTTPITLTLSGLTAGRQYQFQWWSNFSDGGSSSTTAAAGNSVTLNYNPSGSAGGVGQFALGSFTADAATQVITFGSNGSSVINAVQLRDLDAGGGPAVPLPAAVFAGLALATQFGLFTRRLRR